MAGILITADAHPSLYTFVVHIALTGAAICTLIARVAQHYCRHDIAKFLLFFKKHQVLTGQFKNA